MCKWYNIWDFWEGEAERMSSEPWEEWWRDMRDEMSLERPRPEERMTSPPLMSSRSSVIICSWN